jgi:hypothetical protein
LFPLGCFRRPAFGVVFALLALGLVPVAARAADPVLAGAGDIAHCSASASAGEKATAALLDGIDGTIMTLGDAAYEDGSLAQYTNCFGPSWGRHKARIRPAPSDHDYQTPGAAGYFDYFGAAAGPRSRGYYSYDLGAWHVVVLNSNCTLVPGGCGPGSPQDQWLRADLAASTLNCTVAYWHSPRWTSGTKHGNDPAVAPFWSALYEFGAELVLNGNEHNYERFAPQTPGGQRDDAFGIREIVSGTGGRGNYSLTNVRPNSEVRHTGTFGVTKLTLHAGSYDWRFVPVAGKTFTDSGTTACHGRPSAPPPPTPTPGPSVDLAGITPRRDGGGYWTAGINGKVEAFGAGTGHFGDVSSVALARPVVGIAATPTGQGYYLIDPAGKVFAFGDAPHLGDTSTKKLKQPVVGIASARSGKGYWLVAADGGVFSYGSARFAGSTGSLRLNRPIVGMAADPDGAGYWLVASDGGVFSFSAQFSGSTGSIRLNRPIVGMAPTGDGRGYWLVASDGGVFAFDARFHGSTGSSPPARPVVGMAATPTGNGYWIATAGGQVFNFGRAPDLMP